MKAAVVAPRLGIPARGRTPRPADAGHPPATAAELAVPSTFLLSDVDRHDHIVEGRLYERPRITPSGAVNRRHLVSTRLRGDRLQLITFGRYAQSMDIGEFTALPAFREQGTN